jgi:Geranylgeranyl pyrophosphate synthase
MDMTSEETIQTTVKDLFSNISFTAEPKGLYDPLRYMIEIGGKRLRPTLCLTVYSLYKDGFGPEILSPASGLEVFHSFTLIHDDIMDRSPLRRGVETVWKKWDSDTAILSGDVMCIDSYSRIAQAPSHLVAKALALFSKTAAQVCEGQQLDMECENRDDVTMNDYLEMIGLKTAVLIACSAKMGALLAEAPESDCNSIYDYGYNMGLAFQIADDWLDAFGDVKVFGKPIGGDIVNSKRSWLTVRAAEKADEATRRALEEAMAMPVATEDEKNAKIASVMAIYKALDVDSDAKKAISDYTAAALECAGKAVTGEKFDILKRFAGKLVGRRK